MGSATVTFFAVLVIINGAFALECYSCNSNDNTVCKWGITSFLYSTEDCAKAGFFDSIISPKCFKITAQSKDGKEYIARGCLPPATIGCGAMAKAVGWLSSSVSNNDPDNLQNLSCETCETDKCNSATKLTGFAFIGLILSAMAFLL